MIYLGHRFARLIAIESLGLRLDRYLAVGANEEEIREGFLESQLTDSVVLRLIRRVLHRCYIALGVIGATDKSVTTFPEGVREASPVQTTR